LLLFILETLLAQAASIDTVTMGETAGCDTGSDMMAGRYRSFVEKVKQIQPLVGKLFESSGTDHATVGTRGIENCRQVLSLCSIYNFYF